MTEKAAPTALTPYMESKRFVLRGALLLLAGSLLLLLCLLPLPEPLELASVIAGAATLLLGNGYIIYGLLIFAGSDP